LTSGVEKLVVANNNLDTGSKKSFLIFRVKSTALSLSNFNIRRYCRVLLAMTGIASHLSLCVIKRENGLPR
jgi:hypothetical protein